MSYDYSRYLAAKKSVDDRALNRAVLAELRRLMPSGRRRVLEIGAGVGTMVARLLEWQVIGAGEYVLLDVEPLLLRDSRTWLGGWAAAHDMPTASLPDGLLLGDLRVRFVEAELGRYLHDGSPEPVDVLIANSFLDLVDLPAVLPGLLRLLAPEGVYWFTINFDGSSIFQPDHPLDERVVGAYHRTMEGRVRYGRPAGESRTGRHLFPELRAAGAPPLSSGSSDWVVHAGPDGTYPEQEAFFLDCILQTVEEALAGRIEAADLAEWMTARRRQLTSGELVYVAHQLDFAGRSPG